MLPFIAITLFCFSANIYVACWGESKDDLYYIEFHVYSRQKSYPDILTSSDKFGVAISSVKKRTNTIIYIHGWMGSANTEGAAMIRDAYLKHDDCNVILVDWSNAAKKFYFRAVNYVEKIGKYIAEMIILMWIGLRMDVANLHIIGFSLGAHVAGFVGKKLAPGRVRRITGLDPAGPEFHDKPPSERLDKSDAEFVDVIHTNTGLWGTYKPLGHVDFYPNGGLVQKNCERPDISCSHQMANKFYAQSISNPTKFVGIQCVFHEGHFYFCFNNKNITMGHSANPRARGVFHVNTE